MDGVLKMPSAIHLIRSCLVFYWFYSEAEMILSISASNLTCSWNTFCLPEMKSLASCVYIGQWESSAESWTWRNFWNSFVENLQFQAGRTVCEPKKCDCRSYINDGGRFDDVGGCCAHCNATCRHQLQPHLVYYLGDTWHFQCQRCQCLVL